MRDTISEIDVVDIDDIEKLLCRSEKEENHKFNAVKDGSKRKLLQRD